MLLENGKDLYPIEDGSSAPGAGSVGSHWKEGTFDDELMTPISNGSNSMGDMTIAAMKDLGYQINPSKQDPHTVGKRYLGRGRSAS